MNKTDRMKALADALRSLAEKIEDEGTDVLDARMESKSDVADGMAPGGAYHEYRRNGRFTHDIHVELYVPKSDDAHEDGTWWRLQPSIDEVIARVPWTD